MHVAVETGPSIDTVTIFLSWVSPLAPGVKYEMSDTSDIHGTDICKYKNHHSNINNDVQILAG